MITYILAGVVIAIAVGMFISSTKDKKQNAKTKKAETVGGANVTNDLSRVYAGGVFELPAFGDQLSPIETYVKTRNRYSDSETSWYELVCDFEGRKLNVEWEKEGQSINVVAGFDDENPSLEDIGLTETQLSEFDDNESGSFEWSGQTWLYADSDELSFYENDGDDKERFYGWEFQSKDGKRFITVEKWQGDATFYVYTTHKVNTDKVNVFDGGTKP
jgi:hypothetical protein